MRAVQRKKVTKGDFLVAAGILAAAVVLMLFLFSKSAQAPAARVVIGGEEVLFCRLDELKEPMRYEVSSTYPLTLELSRDGVCVVETSCPGEDCRHMGMVTESGRQIVCLPNRLVVLLEGTDEIYDAVTG